MTNFSCHSGRQHRLCFQTGFDGMFSWMHLVAESQGFRMVVLARSGDDAKRVFDAIHSRLPELRALLNHPHSRWEEYCYDYQIRTPE